MDDVNTAAIILSMQCETYVPELYPNIHHRHGNNIGICDVIMCDVISRCFISCEHSGILLYFMVLYLYIYFNIFITIYRFNNECKYTTLCVYLHTDLFICGSLTFYFFVFFLPFLFWLFLFLPFLHFAFAFYWFPHN